jgi:hypothetical protein
MEYKCTSDETLVTTTSIVLTKLSSLIDQFAKNDPELNQENKTFESLSRETIPKKISQLATALNSKITVAKKTTCFSPNTLWKKPQTKAPKRGDSIINSNKN